MQEKLRTLVVSLRSSSDGVFIGAGEIASGRQDLSSRTEQQAKRLAELIATFRVGGEAPEADPVPARLAHRAPAARNPADGRPHDKVVAEEWGAF